MVQLGLVLPILEHGTGQQRDVSQSAEVQGNVGLLAAFLVHGFMNSIGMVAHLLVGPICALW